MASINEKLNYINETKSLIKNKLNDLGSEITNQTTFREYAEKIEDLYEEWPKTSDINTSIFLNNTKKGKMNISLKGNINQFTTTGKNLLDVPSIYSIATKTTKTLTLPAGTYYITCGEVVKGGTSNPVLVWDGTSIYLTTNKSTTKTLTEETTLNLEFYSNGWSYSSSQGITSIINNLMISTSGGDYEPYTGGIASPNYNYFQNVETVTGNNVISICKNNLFDCILSSETLSNNITVSKNDNGTFTLNGTATSNIYIPISDTKDLDAGTYTLKIASENSTAISGSYVSIRYSDNSMVENTNIVQLGNQSTTITLTKRAKYRLGLYIKNEVNINNLLITPMFYKGTSALDYEKYTSINYPINLGNLELYKIKNLEDYIYKFNNKWFIYNYSAKFLLDGTNQKFINKHSTITSENKGFYKASLPNKNETYSSGAIDTAYSNYFKLVDGTASNAFNNNDCGMWWQNTGESVYFILNETSLTDANNWLKSHNTLIYYILSTPTTTEITDTTLINQLNNLKNAFSYDGNTNILQTNDIPFIITASALEKNSN